MEQNELIYINIIQGRQSKELATYTFTVVISLLTPALIPDLIQASFIVRSRSVNAQVNGVRITGSSDVTSKRWSRSSTPRLESLTPDWFPTCGSCLWLFGFLGDLLVCKWKGCVRT
jgi:hypothetical protein